MTDHAATTPADDLGSLCFCPACGKPTVNYEQLAGTANCRSCDWKGLAKDLLSQPVDPTEAANLSILARQDFIKQVAGALTPVLAAWLRKWGFVVINKYFQGDVLLYVKNGSNALYQALLETREAIAKDPNRG